MRKLCIGAIIAAGVLLLTGCGGIADSVHRGLPDGLTVQSVGEGPLAVWVDDGNRFAVVTWGSSSCPAVATALTVEADDHLALTFGSSTNNPCTADMAATTHEFTLPDGITARPVLITVAYEDWDTTHTLTLP